MAEFVPPKAEEGEGGTKEEGKVGGGGGPDIMPEAAVPKKMPTVVLVIGMAGAGKTTLMHRINLHVQERGLRGYFINLDPACRSVPFAANIDIRDTVNYKEVMQQYGLGPNGSILTSLNLFATRFDQVVDILEKRAHSDAGLDYIFVDTPGQIEAFTWNAGGQIIHELLSSTFPTIILYITDTPRCTSPTTFMSNMLYACSMLYKSRLPIVCAFNKIDVVPCAFAEEWMADFEAYQQALDADKGEDYMGSFNRSLSLVMDEFYRNINCAGVSAVTGAGIPEMFTKIDEAAVEFTVSFLPDLEKRREERKALEEEQKQASLSRLEKDMREARLGKAAGSSSSSSNSSSGGGGGGGGGESKAMAEDENEDTSEDA